MPRFSIVTISYNQRDYLQSAIRSVLDQRRDLFEYIIMDGGSSDDSKALIESHSEELAYWQSCSDGGPSNALKTAVEKCHGDFLVYINSDDMLLPGALETLDARLNEYPKVDVLYGHGVSFDERQNRLYKVFSDRWGTKAYARGLVSIFQQSCALRLDSIRRAGNFNPQNRTCWDGELLFQIGRQNGRFQRIDDFIGLFRIHQASITGSQDTSDQYVRDRAELARLVGVDKTLRGGSKSTLLKSLRDPTLMLTKLQQQLFGSSQIIIRGSDVATLVGASS